MARGRGLLLAPALLGAYWMAKGRSGRSGRSSRGLGQSLLGEMFRGRSRRGGFGQSLLASLFGRSTGSRLFR